MDWTKKTQKKVKAYRDTMDRDKGPKRKIIKDSLRKKAKTKGKVNHAYEDLSKRKGWNRLSSGDKMYWKTAQGKIQAEDSARAKKAVKKYRNITKK